MASEIIMFDAIDITQIPVGPAAVGAYVDGRWPTAAAAAARFPHARILTIAASPEHDAEALDIEIGDATPADAPAWHERQRKRGVQRPCLYASAGVMQTGVIPALQAAGIPRAEVRLWSAHYAGRHICGPSTCGELSIDADGTQWTSSALGLVLDQSLLLEDFFTTQNPTAAEAELQSGQLNTGHGVFTVIAVPPGSAHQIAFGVDNHAQNVPVAQLSVAFFDTAWHVHPHVVLDGNKGLGILAFPNPSKTGVISVRRNDAGNAAVGYVVY